MTLSLWTAVSLSALGVFLLMIGLWAIQLRTKNAGIVDLGWTGSVLLMAAFCCVFSQGDFIRKGVLFGMVFLWAARLLWHLTLRFMRHASEDARYGVWREAQKDKANIFFLFVFLFQGSLAMVLSVPFWIIMHNAKPGLHTLEWLGLFLWTVAFIGESIADRQLAQFKANPANRQKVCDIGLWNHSRHPNYFFECLIWVSYFIFALGSPFGGWSILSPALMIYFIVKVSGLPPAEQQSLRSKGERYRDYQRTTSALIPWFKKRHT